MFCIFQNYFLSRILKFKFILLYPIIVFCCNMNRLENVSNIKLIVSFLNSHIELDMCMQYA